MKKRIFIVIMCFFVAFIAVLFLIKKSYNVSAATDISIDDSFLPYVFKDGVIENEFENNVYITEDNELFTLRDGLKIDDAYPDLIDDITYYHMAGYYDFTYINNIFRPLLISLPYYMGYSNSAFGFTLYKISFYNLSGSPFIRKTITIQAEPLNNRIWLYIGYPCRINVDYISEYPTNYIFDNEPTWGEQDIDGYWHTQFGQIPYDGLPVPTVTYSDEDYQLASDTVIKASIIAYRNIGYNDGYNDGYEAGYDDGYEDGYEGSYDENYYDEVYEAGYVDGYNDGYNTGISGTITVNWFTSFINSVFDIFNIEIFPNVRLIYLFFIPIGLGIILLILKLIRG